MAKKKSTKLHFDTHRYECVLRLRKKSKRNVAEILAKKLTFSMESVEADIRRDCKNKKISFTRLKDIAEILDCDPDTLTGNRKTTFDDIYGHLKTENRMRYDFLVKADPADEEGIHPGHYADSFHGDEQTTEEYLLMQWVDYFAKNNFLGFDDEDSAIPLYDVLNESDKKILLNEIRKYVFRITDNDVTRTRAWSEYLKRKNEEDK